MWKWLKKKYNNLCDGALAKACKFVFSIYWVYIIVIVLAVLLLGFKWGCISVIDAVFEPAKDEVVSASGSNVGKVISYNCYLDFSPSMRRFFCGDITSNMHTIADILEQINAANEDNNFFWCRDNVENVREAETFYESMKSEEIAEKYYHNIVVNDIGSDEDSESDTDPSESSQFDRVMANIDLSLLFATSNAGASSAEMDNLNVIITDMVFAQSENSLVGHNRMVEQLASRLALAAADANISIYAIASDYRGRINDGYSLEETVDNVETGMFYVIIYSDNIREYKNYLKRFEAAMTTRKVNYSKFELLNNLFEDQKLNVDLEEYKRLGMIEKENVNLANGMFRGLSSNEFAIQLVSNGTEGSLVMPVSELKLSGYYVSGTVGMDDTEISVETELYYPIYGWRKDSYEEFQDVSMVRYGSAGMYYDEEQWFLRLNLSLSNRPDIPSRNRWLADTVQNIRGDLGNKYIVLNLKFYMEKPSYSKPDWVGTLSFPQGFEDALNIETVMDRLIYTKEIFYVQQSKADRYLGNIVIYALY